MIDIDWDLGRKIFPFLTTGYNIAMPLNHHRFVEMLTLGKISRILNGK